MTLRIMVVGESNLLRDSITRLIEAEQDMALASIAENPNEAIDILEDEKCHIVMIHCKFGTEEIISFLKQVNNISPFPPKTTVFDIPSKIKEILLYMESGVSGIVLREDSASIMIEKIRALDIGKPILSPSIAAAMINRLTELADYRGLPQSNTLLENLTQRELEVLNLLAQNLSNRQIARQLYIEVGTVKNHVHRILKKLEVPNRRAAASLLLMANIGESEI